MPFNFQNFSMSSSDFSFVSGTSRHTNRKATTDMIIYIQKVLASPTEDWSMGKVCDTRNTAAHKKKMATDIALPRTCVGNISATTTKVSGPSEMAKKAI